MGLGDKNTDHVAAGFAVVPLAAISFLIALVAGLEARRQGALNRRSHDGVFFCEDKKVLVCIVKNSIGEGKGPEFDKVSGESNEVFEERGERWRGGTSSSASDVR